MSVNMNSGMVTIGENIGGGVPVFYFKNWRGGCAAVLITHGRTC